MQFKLFKVPLSDTHQAEQELNKFLQSHRVLQVERHFCPDANGYWAFCLEYVGNASLDGEPSVSRQAKKNYSKELNEEEFRRFEFFKNVRRQIAQQKALPAYMIFTDAELAVLARVPELSEETAKTVKGVAPSRLREYVSYFYVITDGEESGEPDAPNSNDGEPS